MPEPPEQSFVAERSDWYRTASPDLHEVEEFVERLQNWYPQPGVSYNVFLFSKGEKEYLFKELIIPSRR